MANQEHVNLLLQGVDFWNQWRDQNPQITPDLSGEELPPSGVNLEGLQIGEADFFWSDLNLRAANLSGVNCLEGDFHAGDLSGADLSDATFVNCDFSRANVSRGNLSRAQFIGVNFHLADLTNANLSQADLTGATLIKSNLSDADLRGAKLFWANLTEANLQGANLTGCAVYGISVWNVDLTRAKQEQLIVNRPDQPVITVDHLEMAQFIYLLLNNQKIRSVIDTITSKVVLILGRFTLQRKQVLDAIRDALRRRDYLPVVFDFDTPANRDITETVSTLAHMSRFVIADITDAKSIPQELLAIVPDLPSVPVQPLLQKGTDEYGMFEHFRRFPWVLEVFRYEDTFNVIAALQDKVIGPAEEKAKEMAAKQIKGRLQQN
jgi:uncharacterized protein YjbI with pentapeptide repeats